MLTPEQEKARRGKLTASSVGTLISGSEEALLNLYYQLIESPAYVAPDFSDNWPVQIGIVTEALNLAWYVKKYNTSVTRQGEVVTHENGWAANTLDGWDTILNIPIQAKHVNAYKKMPDVCDYYMPQLHWEMFVNKTDKIAFSVIIGSNEPQVEFVEWSQGYFDELYARAEAFMECVRNFTPPVAIPRAPLQTVERKFKDIDVAQLEASGEVLPNWVATIKDYVHDWKTTVDSAKKNEEAKEAIKSILPNDVGSVLCPDVIIKRSKNNAISIRKK